MAQSDWKNGYPIYAEEVKALTKDQTITTNTIILANHANNPKLSVTPGITLIKPEYFIKPDVYIIENGIINQDVEAGSGFKIARGTVYVTFEGGAGGGWFYNSMQGHSNPELDRQGEYAKFTMCSSVPNIAGGYITRTKINFNNISRITIDFNSIIPPNNGIYYITLVTRLEIPSDYDDDAPKNYYDTNYLTQPYDHGVKIVYSGKNVDSPKTLNLSEYNQEAYLFIGGNTHDHDSSGDGVDLGNNNWDILIKNIRLEKK